MFQIVRRGSSEIEIHEHSRDPHPNLLLLSLFLFVESPRLINSQPTAVRTAEHLIPFTLTIQSYLH